MERQRRETEERESDKILLLFYNTCYMIELIGFDQLID